ncbi:MAG: DUF5011 domain-containing protein [Chitinispirillaceae bacterium]|nr:DUF5011 domain-containing protein [Chitinispirillaceae bacterium]
MKKTLQSSLFIFSLLLAGCSQIDYNHPLDSQAGYHNPDHFNDEDGDGIANLWDADHEYYKSNLDTTPPVITLPSDDTIWIPYGDKDGIYRQLKTWYTVTDNRPDPVTVIVRPDFSVKFPGTIIVEYVATDKYNNTSQKSRVVVVLQEAINDNEPPQISASPKNPEIFEGSSFDPLSNVTAYDNKDGVITSKITFSGSYDVNKAGEYTITYSVTDESNNTGTLVRILKVFPNDTQDTDFPEITLTGSSEMKIGLNEDWVEPGYKAIDPTEGDITDRVSISGAILPKGEPGVFSITYTVSDNALHTASETRIVQRGDPVDPIVTLKNPEDSVITLAKGDVFKIPELNIVDPDKNEKIEDIDYFPKFNTNTPDTSYLIMIIATDSDGNFGQLRIKVVVGNGGTQDEDTEPPVITIKGKNPDTVTVSASKTYKDSGATAKDNVDGTVTVTPSGTVDLKKEGKNTITYIAKDKAGNADTAFRTVVVVAAKSNDLLSKYEVLTSTALTTIRKTYGKATTDGDAAKAPDLSKMSSFTIDWNLSQKRVNHMAIEMPYPGTNVNLTNSTHTLDKTSPTIEFSGTKIARFDGEYYVTLQGTSFVMVRKDGSFAIIMEP